MPMLGEDLQLWMDVLRHYSELKDLATWSDAAKRRAHEVAASVASCILNSRQPAMASDDLGETNAPGLTQFQTQLVTNLVCWQFGKPSKTLPTFDEIGNCLAHLSKDTGLITLFDELWAIGEAASTNAHEEFVKRAGPS